MSSNGGKSCAKERIDPYLTREKDGQYFIDVPERSKILLESNSRKTAPMVTNWEKDMLNLERQADILNRLEQHWKEGHGQSGTRATHEFTIALTREAGAPGTSVARELGRRLGWPVYDHELLEMIAREMGLRTNLVESVDERRQSWLLESVQGLATAPSVSESSYVRHLVETVLSLGAHGRCVIVGRGAAHILPPQFTLRVRLVGPIDGRIQMAADRRQITEEAAARWVEATDRERERFVKDHFLKDPTDPRNYDVVLNVGLWSVTECADLILQGLKMLESHHAGSTTGG
jgi:cytidylate kinase